MPAVPLSKKIYLTNLSVSRHIWPHSHIYCIVSAEQILFCRGFCVYLSSKISKYENSRDKRRRIPGKRHPHTRKDIFQDTISAESILSLGRNVGFEIFPVIPIHEFLHFVQVILVRTTIRKLANPHTDHLLGLGQLITLF